MQQRLQYSAKILFFAACLMSYCMIATPVFSATPLPSEFYSPQDRSGFAYLNQMTFVIPSANALRQAARTLTLANKRQRAGIQTVILFQGTSITLPILRGVPQGRLTTYTGENPCVQPHSMPKCPPTVSDTVPPLIPEIAIPNAETIYLPLLRRLLLEHACLGGKIALCPCCHLERSSRITFLPQQIPYDKVQRLKKKMHIKEGDY